MSSACDRKNSLEGMALQIILSTGRNSYSTSAAGGAGIPTVGIAGPRVLPTLGIAQPASLLLLLAARAGKGSQPPARCAAPRCVAGRIAPRLRLNSGANSEAQAHAQNVSTMAPHETGGRITTKKSVHAADECSDGHISLATLQ